MEILIVIALIIGFLLGRFLLIKRGPRHDHIWKFLDSNTVNLYAEHVRHPNSIPTQRTTQVLKGCFCGETKVFSIDGHWSAEKLKSLEA